MSKVYFITHPEVEIDKNTPVTEWGLSEQGRARFQAMLRSPWVTDVGAVYASSEHKAKVAAEALTTFLNVPITVIPELGEMNRTSTGFLEPKEFEAVVNEAFAYPEQSIRGWERLADAQARIVDAAEKILLSSDSRGAVAIVSHGGVGTLLKCRLKNIPISRSEDQPGQGYYFVFDAISGRLLQDWTRIDDVKDSF